MTLVWSPSLPPWLLLTLALLTILFGAWGIFRHVRGQIFKTIALLIVLLWLAGPGLRQPSIHMQPQDVLVLVDHTSSMNLRQRREMADRAADELVSRMRLMPGVTPYRVTISDNQDGSTRLFEALRQEAQDHPDLAAIFMLTDGMNHDTPSSLDAILPAFKHRSLPLHVLLTAKGEETDRTLQILSAPPYGIVGTEAHIHVRINDLGGKTLEGARIYARQNSDKPHFVTETTNGQSVDIPVRITHSGANLIELSTSDLPGEVSTQNNRLVVSIQGIQDHLKVMLVSGAPTPSARIWRDLLKADPSVDLVHFVILRSPETADDTPLSELALIPFPTHELFVEKTSQFDLIILDGFDNPNLLPESYIDNITHYVRQGGGLLVISSSELAQPGSLQDTSLGSVLPAHVAINGTKTDLIRPQLSALGQIHPVTSTLEQKGTWGDTWGPWYRYLKTDRVRGSVLLTTQNHEPLLLLDKADKGRVAQILSDQVWLWSRGGNGGGPQQELLRRLSHWLMKEPDLEGERLKARLNDRQITIDRYSLAEHDLLTATVLSPLGENYAVKMKPLHNDRHHLRGLLTLTTNDRDNQGIWTVRQDDLLTFIADTGPQIPETEDLRSTAQNLAPLAQASGGGIFWLGRQPAPDLKQVRQGETLSGTDWAGLPLHPQKLPGSDHFYPLLPPWLALLLVLPLVSLGWWREGH
ncbi:VWA domain-containing protein [Acetobacteraceae bacterium ESL0709]|nr:VWA domain-containing protein [Acetobacteraceae bacterium ESL0697]MDF7678650.1 VWA domain-containing protein [Acetobacteraceae bacterium ESL0709]